MTAVGGWTWSGPVAARTRRSRAVHRSPGAALAPTQVALTARSLGGSSAIARPTARSRTTRLAAETVASAQAARATPAAARTNAPGRAVTRPTPIPNGMVNRREAAGTRSLNTGKVFLQVSRVPRYDLPKAAPQPLRLVQSFVNTVDLENDREWLPDPAALASWAHERHLVPNATTFTRRDLRRALDLREAFRALLQANHDRRRDEAALEVLARAADSARLTVAFAADGFPELESRARGIDALCGRLVGVAVGAMLDGSWERLKACRNCRWAFFDESKNRSARWCSMELCGNRLKTRAYRRRRRQT
jgi:predicted RNA-binding Zn ribbon-like protein